MNIVFILSILFVIYIGLSIFIPRLRMKYRITNVPLGTVTCIGACISGVFLMLISYGLIPGWYSPILIGGFVIGVVISLAGGFIDHKSYSK